MCLSFVLMQLSILKGYKQNDNYPGNKRCPSKPILNIRMYLYFCVIVTNVKWTNK